MSPKPTALKAMALSPMTLNPKVESSRTPQRGPSLKPLYRCAAPGSATATEALGWDPKRWARSAWRLGQVAGALLLVSACERKAEPTETEATTTETQPATPDAGAPTAAPLPQEAADDGDLPPVARGVSLPARDVLAVVNPKHRPAYDGPTGKVRGHVTMTGDPPSAMPVHEIPAECAGAREMFGVAYRQGMNRRVADVLVAVTGYDGYVPPLSDAVVVEGRDCAWSTRTVALTYGQRIDVVSKDRNTYVPELLGQPWPVQLLATPGRAPLPVSPLKVGQYMLIDAMRLYSKADVYVLAYPTAAVTGLDGSFEIDRIPPGKVTVNALLPITGAVTEQSITVEAGKTTEVELTLSFDAAAFDAEASKRAEAEEKLRSRKTP